jgi:dTDP-4-amino-4,6-dideoxygalactose transaminase
VEATPLAPRRWPLGGQRLVPALPSLWPSALSTRPRGPGLFPFQAEEERLRSTYFARNAIHHAVRSLGLSPGDQILVPAYHHGVEMEALSAAGLHLVFYPVDADLRGNLEAAERLITSRTKSLYVVHFMGFPQPMEEARALCERHGLVLMEDCALALLSSDGDRPLGSSGDVSFFCLYKTLPVPNGGVLCINRPDLVERFAEPVWPRWTPPSVASVASQLVGSALVSVERSLGWPARLARQAARWTVRSALSALGVRRVPVGSDHFVVDQAGLGMSPVVRHLVDRLDHRDIVRRRRQNYLTLAELLGRRAPPMVKQLDEGVCPLFYPTRMRGGARAKEAVVQALLARGVEAVDFWSQGHPAARGRFPEVERLRAEVLELPIHQDLDETDLQWVARATGEALDERAL